MTDIQQQDKLPILQCSRLLFQAADFHLANTIDELYKLLDQSLFELLGRSNFTVFTLDRTQNRLNRAFSSFPDKKKSAVWSFRPQDHVMKAMLDDRLRSQSLLIQDQNILQHLPCPTHFVSLLQNDGIIFGLLVIHEGLDTDLYDPFPVVDILEPLIRNFTLAHAHLQERQAVEKRFGETTGKLLAINEVGELLGQLNLETLLSKIMSLALQIVRGEVGSLMIYKEDHLESRLEWGLNDQDVLTIQFKDGQKLVDHVYENKAAVLIEDLPKDDRFLVQTGDHPILSIVTIPLHTKNKNLGVLNVVNTRSGESFHPENLTTLQTVASLASTAIENAMLHEEAVKQKVFEEQLRIAKQIWENIMPQSVPTFASATIAAKSVAATVVGGDFYDFIPLDENRVGLVLADVSGKGIPAAMMMNTAKSVLNIEATRNPSSLDLITNVNNLLIQSAKIEGFITLVYVVADFAQRKLYITSAGHNPTLVYHTSEGRCELLTSESVPLAIMAGETFSTVETSFSPGDCMLLYTDGITEARNPEKEMFGMDRLQELLARSALLDSADQVLESIFQEVRTFAGEAKQHDDMTVLALKINSTS